MTQREEGASGSTAYKTRPKKRDKGGDVNRHKEEAIHLGEDAALVLTPYTDLAVETV
jgi:hypothetical protein